MLGRVRSRRSGAGDPQRDPPGLDDGGLLRDFGALEIPRAWGGSARRSSSACPFWSLWCRFSRRCSFLAADLHVHHGHGHHCAEPGVVLHMLFVANGVGRARRSAYPFRAVARIPRGL
eukprot:159079-Pyramimonas_sp.AAC.1